MTGQITKLKSVSKPNAFSTIAYSKDKYHPDTEELNCGDPRRFPGEV